MAAYEKLAVLAYKLHQMTNKAKISWQQTATAGVFQASFPDYAVRISIGKSQSSAGANDVRISIFGDDGNEIESFTDEDIDPAWLFELSRDRNPYEMMYETYETARRLALGTEQAVNQILSALEDDDDIPF